jgi:hypothetical protein
MSLIPSTAPLIRLAAVDDGYAQNLYDAVYNAVKYDEDTTAINGLVEAPIREYELTSLASTEWQWYASWRQALGGLLDPVVLRHLTASASTRFARFQVRELVLCDPRTNELAPRRLESPDEPDAIGLRWLSAQARSLRVDDAFEEQAPDARDDEPPEEQTPDARDDEALELMNDALQCATEASWYLLRQLLSVPDDLAELVANQLQAFAEDRGIDEPPWFGLGEPVGG